MSVWRDKYQLCWDCANAVPTVDGTRGCAWSKRFQPVQDWQAKTAVIPVHDMVKGNCRPRKIQTYQIRKCPQFTPDPPRKMTVY